MNAAGLEKAGILILVMAVSPLIARWRVAHRERARADSALFDAVLLEAALAPRDPDDPATLEVLRAFLRGHNSVREADRIVTEIVRLHGALTDPQRTTLRGALRRLRECGDATLEGIATEALRLILITSP